MIRKIGLTGSMASGKSRVAEMLASKLGCDHIDADESCRVLLEPKAEGWQAISRLFSGKYVMKDGRIDRLMLRQDLFADKDLRRTINSIIHPLAQKEIVARIDAIINSDEEARVLVEVPLLFEAGWENLFDTIVVVSANENNCIERLMQRDGVGRDTAEKELASQMKLVEKKKRADHIIDNSGSLSETFEQVARLAELLRRSNGLGKSF